MSKIVFSWKLWVCMAGLACTVGCSSGPEPENTNKDHVSDLGSTTAIGETSTSGDIYIAVDESIRPVVEAMVATFTTTYSQAKVNVLYMPGEKAIQALLRTDSIRLAVTNRMLTNAEEAILRKQNTSSKVKQMGTGAIALILNKENPNTRFTQEQVVGILTGKITDWNQIDPESKLGPVSVVFDHGSSSTVRYLSDSLLLGKEITPAKAFSAGSNPKALTFIGETPGALGIIGVAWISDSDDQQAIGFKKDISIAKIENPIPCAFTESYGKFLQPYQGMIKADCYPFTTPLYTISRETRFGLGTGFVSYVMDKNTGQRIILKAGLVPERAVPREVQFPKR